MRVAVVNELRHRAGDLNEYLLLRAIHSVASGYVPAEAVIVAGELTDGPPEEGFLTDLFASLARKKVELPVIWLARPSGVTLPEVPAQLGGEEPAALLNRIRQAGALPEFHLPPYEIAVADCRADGSIRLERQAMTIPEVPGMTDYHIHTELAYCSENMNLPRALEMARISRIEHASFIEHSGHLYFRKEDYWAGRWVWGTRGTSEGCPVQNRTAGLREVFRQGAEAGDFYYGLELDVDRKGEVVLDRRDRDLAQLRLGAVHQLDERYDRHVAKRQFLLLTESLLSYGIHVLAHPFRIFLWSGLEKPEAVFEPVADLLKRYGTAAELNFHGNTPDLEFFDICLKKGVKIAFGSDSHNLYEVGFFLPHMKFVKDLGAAGKLDEILYQFKPESLS